MDRRSFLTRLVPAAALGLAAAQAPLAAGKDAALVITPLADAVTLISGAGGNVVVLRSAEGVLLVDGGARANSPQLLQAVRGIAGTARVHTLFNTHWHADQTGSNATLGAAGTRIIAHENTRLWLTTDV
ncbi:MAG: MBL fold metallo-hydrolase, partial [Steroidobacteraceae bacterium]